MEKKQAFSWRSFISFGLFFSFIIIFLTGIVLYLAPAGRIAHWVNWKLFFLKKEEWQAIHTIFSYLFAILSIFHLFSINWKVFLTYLKAKARKGLNKKKELLISTALTVLIFTATIFSIPPFSSVMEFGDYLTESWENQNNAPPIPHAELLSLNELSQKLDSLTIEKISNRLNKNKIKFDNPNQTLTEIGEINNIPPLKIYTIITAQTSLTGMAGSGMGQKTLEEYAKEYNKDIEKILEILKTNNINATKNQTLKDIASENDMAAKDIYQLIK